MVAACLPAHVVGCETSRLNTDCSFPIQPSIHPSTRSNINQTRLKHKEKEKEKRSHPLTHSALTARLVRACPASFAASSPVSSPFFSSAVSQSNVNSQPNWTSVHVPTLQTPPPVALILFISFHPFSFFLLFLVNVHHCF